MSARRGDITVRIITANIQANLATAWVLTHLRDIIAHRPDVAGFQEIGGRTRAAAMRVYLWAHGYRWVQRHGRNRESVPLAYRRRGWRLVDRGSWHLSNQTPVGRAGAGPRKLREKWATWVFLEHRVTGVRILVVNCHLAPSIRIPVRGRLHAAQVAALADLSELYDDVSRCFIGDFNTEDPDRLRALLDTGLRMGEDVATHGPHSAIDRCLTDLTGTRRALPAGHFDHRPLETDLTIPIASKENHR